MGINRRQLLFGSTFVGLAGGMSSAAQACSMEIVSPLEWRFWRRAYFKHIGLPLFRRSQSQKFVSAILHGSQAQLATLLAREVTLLLPPGGAYANPSPGKVLLRQEALTRLSQLARSGGRRSLEIHHLASLSPYAVIIDMSMSGYGPPDPTMNPYGLCGSDPREWAQRIVWRLEFGITSDVSPPLIERVMMVQPF